MVATDFISYVNSFSATTYVGLEDLADRANFQWNVIVLFICMVLVTVKQYYMAPLVCYLPTTFSGANVESYVTNLCWVEGTLPLNLTSGTVSHKDEDWDSKNEKTMNYYQWVPLMLGLQAIAYYIPRLIWSMFTFNRAGTDLQNLIKSASGATKEDGEKRAKTVNHLAKSMEMLLFNRREITEVKNGVLTRVTQVLPGKRHGNNLIYYYIFIKILYVLIGFGQLYVMYIFLRFDKREGYVFFGFRILDDIVKGKAWTETQVFPRIGACRHKLQHVGAGNNIFAQCVLPVNMLNEKIYVFLYFFLGAVMIMTAFSIPLWLIRISAFRQRHFVKRFFRMADVYDRNNLELKELIDRFIDEFLRQDGHFLLRMLAMNAGDLVTVEIVCALFANYRKTFLGKDFRGRVSQARGSNGEYPGNGILKGFMSTKLQPGGYASAKQRPLPTAPVEASPPYPDDEEFHKMPIALPYQMPEAPMKSQGSGTSSPKTPRPQNRPPQQNPSPKNGTVRSTEV